MILGRFYFKQTQNGNLLGEFSNQTSHENRTESADFLNFSIERENNVRTLFLPNTTPAFLGTYNTTWFEGTAIANHLRIFPKNEDNNFILLLEWTNASTGFVFRGEGFIVDGILIGNYWDNDIPEGLRAVINAAF